MDRSNCDAFWYPHFVSIPFKPLSRLTPSPGTGHCKRWGEERCYYFCRVRVTYAHLTRLYWHGEFNLLSTTRCWGDSLVNQKDLYWFYEQTILEYVSLWVFLNWLILLTEFWHQWCVLEKKRFKKIFLRSKNKMQDKLFPTILFQLHTDFLCICKTWGWYLLFTV